MEQDFEGDIATVGINEAVKELVAGERTGKF